MDVNDVLIFARVAQAGSFSRAAQQLKMPVSTVSRRVSQLEEALGVPLLIRTTRSLKITEIGKAYLEHGRAIAVELERAQTLATNLQSIPQGTLRITASTDFGNQLLGPILCDFLESHPRINADVVLTERVIDLIEEGFDIAIRIGELDDSTLMARKLGDLGSALVASPAFLRKHGTPKRLADLARLECILFTGEDESGRWTLSGQGGIESPKTTSRLKTNNIQLALDLALEGKGIALIPSFLCGAHVDAGRLQQVLKSWTHVAGPVHAVYPGQRFQLPKVRAFIDHLLRASKSIRWKD
jgi:DNA-binding transcriptional LysR family regulator